MHCTGFYKLWLWWQVVENNKMWIQAKKTAIEGKGQAQMGWMKVFKKKKKKKKMEERT